MLRGVGIGPGEQVAHVGVLAVGGPHLLAVDDELVTLAASPGPQRRQVASRAGLAEELTPQVRTGADARQEPLSLLVGAELDDRRRGKRRRPDRSPRPRPGDLLHHDERFQRVGIGATAELLGPVDAQVPASNRAAVHFRIAGSISGSGARDPRMPLRAGACSVMNARTCLRNASSSGMTSNRIVSRSSASMCHFGIL